MGGGGGDKQIPKLHQIIINRIRTLVSFEP